MQEQLHYTGFIQIRDSVVKSNTIADTTNYNVYRTYLGIRSKSESFDTFNLRVFDNKLYYSGSYWNNNTRILESKVNALILNFGLNVGDTLKSDLGYTYKYLNSSNDLFNIRGNMDSIKTQNIMFFDYSGPISEHSNHKLINNVGTVLGLLPFYSVDLRDLDQRIDLDKTLFGSLVYVCSDTIIYKNLEDFTFQNYGHFDSSIDYADCNGYLLNKALNLANKTIHSVDIKKEEVKIYPNPFSETLKIQVANSSSRKVNIWITDTQGKMITTFTTQNKVVQAGYLIFSIDVKNLAVGSYIVHVDGVKKKVVLIR